MNPTVVIGGGPAGSAAAILLARAGESVSLLERKSGAHDKVCGEFISWEAARYLQHLGLNLPALSAQPIRRLGLYNGKDSLHSPLPNTAWSLSRRRLDAALIQQAQQAGADVQQGVAVRGLEHTDHCWTLSTSGQGAHGSGASVSNTQKAETVFLASGKHDIRNWQRMAKQAEGDGMLGLKMHLQLDPTQQAQLHETVEVHLYNGGYAGLELIEQGKANLCFLIRHDLYKACAKQWSQVLDWLTDTSPHLKTRLASATPLWQKPVAIANVPYGYQHMPTEAVPHLFRLGDQTAVIPSVAGDGIAIALRSAFLAARVHTAGGDSQTYQRLAQKDFHTPVRDAQLLTRLLSTEVGRKTAFSLSRLWPGLLAKAISRLRVQGD